MVDEVLPQHRVLIVDDNRDVADMQALLLTLCGQTVEKAYDGATALRVAIEFRPDVVFIDLVMPDIDGVTLAQRLRRIEGLKDVRLIALTAFTGDRFLEATSAAGFDGHMAKPASAADFFTVLRRPAAPDSVEAPRVS